MKKRFLALLVLLMSLYMSPVFAVSYNILNDINIYRAKYNLFPLSENVELCKLAKVRVEEIKTDWSHSQFQPEIDKIPDMSGVFHENLARTFEAKDVTGAWSLSKAGHNEAMLIPEMKYGCVAQSGDYYSFEGYVPEKGE